MNWKDYQGSLEKLASNNGVDEAAIESLVNYARNLFDKKLPIIFDQQHFCSLVGWEYEYVLRMTNATKKFYHRFTIPKKSGGERIIHEPLPDLKLIQKWIMTEILQQLEIHPASKAYLKGVSIRDNARFHKKQKYLLTLDIENFFGSIKRNRVFAVFSQCGYTRSVSTLLTQLCTLNDVLPQGSPSSPALSNAVFRIPDKRIFTYCRKHGIRYTRYADDLAFSGDIAVSLVISLVRKVLADSGFTLNDRKTRLRRQSQQQEVTGIVVNSKMQVARTVRKTIRQEMYYIIKYGLREHLIRCRNLNQNYLPQLLGRVSHTLFVNPNDVEMQSYRRWLVDLLMDSRGDIKYQSKDRLSDSKE